MASKKKKKGGKKSKDSEAPKGVPRDISKEMSTKGKVCEEFEVGKDGDERVVKTCGVEPKKHASKEEIAKQNKLLRNVLIIVGLIFLVTVGTYFIFNGLKYFEYNDRTWDVMQEGSVTFYHTSFPMFKNGKQFGVYDVFLRNNPRNLDRDVEFEGKVRLREMFVLNYTSEIDCGSQGVISIANMNQIFGAMGSTIMRDDNATCDDAGRYLYANIIPSDENKIEEFGNAGTCYNLYVDDCDVLEVTEKFIVEGLKLLG